jgi:fructose-1,6-bisphosphatase/inositol monophosphatase family enzyme
MSARPDPRLVAEIIREAAQAEILPRFGHLAAGDIREKKPGQLVTDADVAAERMLSRRLTEMLPGSLVVGEEAVDGDPDLLHRLEGSEAVWVIDPVDGTANFAKGNPRFAVIIALVVDGVTRMGWIYDPMAERMVIAELGGGAWLNGQQRLSVLPAGPLASLRGSVKRSGKMKGLVAEVGRKGSAAHDYIDLVTDRLHFAHFKTLMPWDHAAGVLIHAEAGGFARLLNDKPYRPVYCGAGLLLAPTEECWHSLRPMVE